VHANEAKALLAGASEKTASLAGLLATHRAAAAEGWLAGLAGVLLSESHQPEDFAESAALDAELGALQREKANVTREIGASE
jgi:hypothetical protein